MPKTHCSSQAKKTYQDTSGQVVSVFFCINMVTSIGGWLLCIINKSFRECGPIIAVTIENYQCTLIIIIPPNKKEGMGEKKAILWFYFYKRFRTLCILINMRTIFTVSSNPCLLKTFKHNFPVSSLYCFFSWSLINKHFSWWKDKTILNQRPY